MLVLHLSEKVMTAIKSTFIFLLLVSHTSFSQQDVSTVLDNWHRSAAQADATSYFGAMTDDAKYIGTDATENWQLTTFKAFAKPYFDSGKAWNFKVLERNIYFSPDRKVCWFDELLDTWMKVCRGSGVLLQQPDGSWKIAHYVLSMTIPNENTESVIKIIAPIEDAYLAKKRQK